MLKKIYDYVRPQGQHLHRPVSNSALNCSECSRGTSTFACVDCGVPKCSHCLNRSAALCPKKHILKTSAPKNYYCAVCRKYLKWEEAMSCQTCNVDVCPSCRPIAKCAVGHDLLISQINERGKCLACARTVDQGETVLQCRVCQFVICTCCAPNAVHKKQCPQKHRLGFGEQEGKCSLCSHPGQEGHYCKGCRYFVCVSCRRAPALTCYNGHLLTKLTLKQQIFCEKCEIVKAEEAAYGCRLCFYFVCSDCRPMYKREKDQFLCPICFKEKVGMACGKCGRCICQGCSSFHSCPFCRVPKQYLPLKFG